MSKNYNKREDEEVNDWRNEHGEPDFPYLQSLLRDDSYESMEKLQSIATDLDVNFTSNASKEEIIEEIRLFADGDE